MNTPSKRNIDQLVSQTSEHVEDITPQEAEELAGGVETNISCSGNNKNDSCTVSNSSCDPNTVVSHK